MHAGYGLGPAPLLTGAELLGLAPGAPQRRRVCSNLHDVGCASPKATKRDLSLRGLHGQLCRREAAMGPRAREARLRGGMPRSWLGGHTLGVVVGTREHFAENFFFF